MNKRIMLLVFVFLVQVISSYGMECSVAFGEKVELIFFENDNYVTDPVNKLTHAVFKGYKGSNEEVLTSFGPSQLEIAINDKYFPFLGNTDDSISGDVELVNGENKISVVSKQDKNNKCTSVFKIDFDEARQKDDFCGNKKCSSIENIDNCIFDCGKSGIKLLIDKDIAVKKIYVYLTGEGVGQLSFNELKVNLLRNDIKISQIRLIKSEEDYQGEYDISRLDLGNYKLVSDDLEISAEFEKEKIEIPRFSVKIPLIPPAVTLPKDPCSDKSYYEQPLEAVLNIKIENLKSNDIIELKNINTGDIKRLDHDELKISFVENPKNSEEIKANIGDKFSLYYNNDENIFIKNIKITGVQKTKVPIKKIEEKRPLIIDFLYQLGDLFTKPFRELVGLFYQSKSVEQKYEKHKEISRYEVEYGVEKMNKEADKITKNEQDK